jgi:hypothetical protein
MERPFGVKHRRHQAHASISAQGPAFSSELEAGGVLLRPRIAADLQYATADSDFLSTFWTDPWDPGEVAGEFRKREPTCQDLWAAIDDACEWLANYADDGDWIGGGLNITFAGHGRYPDGALVVHDGAISADELAEHLWDTWTRLPHEAGRLRVALKLDSCYSGAFLLRWLAETYKRHEALAPYFSHVSSMPDEISLEESSLGHGVFTYCISQHSAHPFAYATRAVQPDNSWGPSIRMAAGEVGCARMTMGVQNPVRFVELGHLEVCGQIVSIEDLLPTPTLADMEARLRPIRDEMRPRVRAAFPEFTFTDISRTTFTDEDALAEINSKLEWLRSTRHLTDQNPPSDG